MKASDVRERAFSMPLASPSYPKGPYRFVDREFFIVTYRTYPEALRQVVPEPLEIKDPLVKYEFIKMPDSTGWGAFCESGQVIAVEFEGQAGGFVHGMYLNEGSPISGGREIWGFPKKLAEPTLTVEKDTLLGTLDYGPVRVATGTMGYKHETTDLADMKTALEAPNFLLKIIPDVDCRPKVCQLVRYFYEDLTVKGAWRGPAALELYRHALAPVANLPVLEVISGVHILTDLTLGLGEVVHDYLVE